MADSIKIGNLDISAFKVGSADTKAYLGDTLLYPTAPPVFEGKYKLTLSDSSTVSAACDATSAITRNETKAYSADCVAIEIGSCVTSIGYSAFYRCSGLTSCTIGSGVTSIGDSVFYQCTSLTSIDIPNNVTSIGGGAFSNCSGLTSCTIGSGVTYIGNQAFYGCSRLTSIDIPNNVTSIGDYAFYQCSGLTSCTIGSGLTSIGSRAFYQCSGLTSITVNATTPPIIYGDYAFSYTNNCPIYVPSASVSAYQSASGWSTYASRIQAIPNN